MLASTACAHAWNEWVISERNSHRSKRKHAHIQRVNSTTSGVAADHQHQQSREREKSGSTSSSASIKITKTCEENAISLAVEALKRGSIIAVPTDTLYGFACDASNSKAIENLYAVKGREKTKPVAVCVSRAEDVKKICELERKVEESLLRKL